MPTKTRAVLRVLFMLLLTYWTRSHNLRNEMRHCGLGKCYKCSHFVVLWINYIFTTSATILQPLLILLS